MGARQLAGRTLRAVFAAATFLSMLVVSVPASAAPTACTEVIGGRQTRQWFGAFEKTLGRDYFQVRAPSGADVGDWSDPTFAGWDSSTVLSDCVTNTSAPDRVILTVSGDYGGDVSAWSDAIAQAVSTVQAKHPVAEIVLQPVVGGPGHAVCQVSGQDVLASVEHPVIDEAILQQAGVSVGPSPEVRTCDDYADAVEALTRAAAGPIGQKIAEAYPNEAEPDPEPPPPTDGPVAVLDTHGAGPGTMITTDVFTPTPGSFLVVMACALSSTGGDATLSISDSLGGTQLPWQESITHATAVNGDQRVSAFTTVLPGDVSAGSVTVAASVSRGRWSVIVAETATQDPQPVGVLGSGEETATGATTLSFALPQLPASDSLLLAAACSKSDSDGITPGSGFTEVIESTSGLRTEARLQLQYDDTPESTVAWSDLFGTSSPSNVGIALEVRR